MDKKTTIEVAVGTVGTVALLVFVYFYNIKTDKEFEETRERLKKQTEEKANKQFEKVNDAFEEAFELVKAQRKAINRFMKEVEPEKAKEILKELKDDADKIVEFRKEQENG